MVLGRRELSAILLAIGAILSYLVLLSATPSGAQTGGATSFNNFTVTIDQNETVVEDQGDEVVAGAESNRPRRERRQREIVNIPNRPLPPSGGFPVYAAVGGSVLTGAGLLALGFMIRRGSRR